VSEANEPRERSREGTTIWGLFPETTKYFAPSPAPFMINYHELSTSLALEGA